MLALIVLLLVFKTSCVTCNVGSVLFYNKGEKDCWSEDEIAKLRARKVFEDIALPTVTPDKVNGLYVKNTLQYFHRTLRTAIHKDADRRSAGILRDALADTIGSHLRSEILPTVRFAYYAGYLPYRNARQLHNLYEDVKEILNTQGNGWTKPSKVPQWANLTVGKILIGSGKLSNPCAFLIVKRDINSCINLPFLKLDDVDKPSALSLPFKVGGLVSLTAPSSENILLKYYTTASRCILTSSPDNCRHVDFINFNNRLWHWMKREVAPHLVDENLYAAYGGILRIAAAVQNYGRDLERRNLYEDDNGYSLKWQPWKPLEESSIYMNYIWSPFSCCIIIIIVIIILYLIIVKAFWNHCSLMWAKHCHCKGIDSRRSSNVEYANVESNFPAILPSHDHYTIQTPRSNYTPRGPSVNCDVSTNHSSKLSTKNKGVPPSNTITTGTLTKDKVYDLSGHKEKLMPVIMSDYEESEIESCSTWKNTDEDCVNNTVIDLGSTRSRRSPPKIDAEIEQLKIERSSGDNRPKQMYSMSTVSRSAMTYSHRQRRDSAWSDTGSATSSSDRSITSATSPSVLGSSRRTRDLAWARKIATGHNTRSNTSKSLSTRNTHNLYSYTTPRS